MDFQALNKELGNADLLLIDQILKGRFYQDMRILDAGCGEGRNMVYFIKNEFQIYGIDQNPEAVSMARLIAPSVNKKYTVENIFTTSIEENPFPAEFFDVVLCINVLHFASNSKHFMKMVEALLKILRKGGYFYIGMECESSDMLAEAKPAIYKKDKTVPEKFLMTKDLMNRILDLKIIEKSEPARFYQIEGSISQMGIWFRKI
jgi:SAM-dependent methyltransferase